MFWGGERGMEAVNGRMGACRLPFVTAVCGSLVQCVWGGEGSGALLTSLSRVIFHGAIRNAVRVRPCCRPRPT